MRWIDGEPQDLGTLGTDSFGMSINNRGNVVGYSYVDGSSHGFFWSPDTGMVDVAPDRPFTAAYDLNEDDVVTGGGGNGHAFRWQDGVYTDLGSAPGFAYSSGMAINESGQVAGSVTSASGNSQRFARHTPGVGWEELGGAGEHNSFWGINDHGDAVGEGTSGGFRLGFAYFEGAGLFLLDNLIANDAWTILDARDINNSREIAAYATATDGSGRFGAVRLVPISGPTVHVGAMSLKLATDPVRGTTRVTAVDGDGRRVPRAKVSGWWAVNGLTQNPEESDRTNGKGVAVLKRVFADAGAGDTVRFCIDVIVKRGYIYDEPSNVKDCVERVVP